jgi:hypothetical protein
MAEPAPLTAQQRIDKRKIEIYNGPIREVHYSVAGLPPERAALYRQVEILENKLTLAMEVDHMNAVNAADAQRLQAFAMAGLNYNFNNGIQLLGTPTGTFFNPAPYPGLVTCWDPSAPPVDPLTLNASLRAAQRALLDSEQDAGAAPAQADKAAVKRVAPLPGPKLANAR